MKPEGDILQQLAARAKQRVQIKKEALPLDALAKRATEVADISRIGGIFGFPFEAALSRPGVNFICECKRASPSRGILAPEYDPVSLARDYEMAGAACVSVLTEPDWFLGSDDHLRAVSAAVSLPCLRKDFTVDEYFIYEAKLLGASAVLLISALLDGDTIKSWIKLCDTLSLSALVETRSELEIEIALDAGARIVGVNNRNLRDFTVDLAVSERLRKLVPPEVLFVAESGIKTPDDVARLRDTGVNGVLIGETLMTSPTRRAVLEYLRGKS
jgi:Indole-3-glycerol phosphate synthase